MEKLVKNKVGFGFEPTFFIGQICDANFWRGSKPVSPIIHLNGNVSKNKVGFGFEPTFLLPVQISQIQNNKNSNPN